MEFKICANLSVRKRISQLNICDKEEGIKVVDEEVEKK